MFKIKMAISSFVLVLWVHVFLVGIIEISGDRNLKLLLSRNRREDPPAGNPTVTSNKTFAELEAAIKALQDLKAKKEALLSFTTEASLAKDMTTAEVPVPAVKNKAQKEIKTLLTKRRRFSASQRKQIQANDITTTERPVPAAENEFPKAGILPYGDRTTYHRTSFVVEITDELQWLEHLWNHENMFETGVVRVNEYVESKTDVNTGNFTDELGNLASSMHEIDDKLKEEEQEISKVQKEEEMPLKYVLPEIRAVKAKKEALLRSTTKASSANDMTTTEGPVPAAEKEAPKGYLLQQLQQMKIMLTQM